MLQNIEQKNLTKNLTKDSNKWHSGSQRKNKKHKPLNTVTQRPKHKSKDFAPFTEKNRRTSKNYQASE